MAVLVTCFKCESNMNSNSTSKNDAGLLQQKFAPGEKTTVHLSVHNFSPNLAEEVTMLLIFPKSTRPFCNACREFGTSNCFVELF